MIQKLTFLSATIIVMASGCDVYCPDGFMWFERTATPNNSMTSLWCVKTIFPETLLNITGAKALCEKENSVLTTFENDEERIKIADNLAEALTSKGEKYGGIFIDGNMLKECETQDSTIRKSPPCYPFSAAYVTQDKHTDSTFMFQNWAHTEPTNYFYEGEFESCMQLTISQFPRRDRLINNVFCNFEKNPLNLGARDVWNNGVACGRLPEFYY